MSIESVKEQYPGVNLGQTICVSPKYKLLYVVNPKAACSSVKLLLSRLESGDFDFDVQNIHLSGASLLPTPAQVGWAKIGDNLKNPSEYYRFSFVRNPVARIVSCYNDKIIKQSSYFVSDLKKAAGYEDTSSMKMDFIEFLNIIKRQDVVEMDQHWRPQNYNLLLDCVDYNFIGKLENFDKDFKHITDSNGCPHVETVNKNKYKSKDKKLTIADLTSDELEIVYSLYEQDFESFGYEFDYAQLSGSDRKAA